jgi:hypothetical protein
MKDDDDLDNADVDDTENEGKEESMPSTLP